MDPSFRWGDGSGNRPPLDWHVAYQPEPITLYGVEGAWSPPRGKLGEELERPRFLDQHHRDAAAHRRGDPRRPPHPLPPPPEQPRRDAAAPRRGAPRRLRHQLLPLRVPPERRPGDGTDEHRQQL